MDTKLLKYERGRRGLTLDKLSKLSGVNIVMISRIESGKIKKPQIRTIMKLAEALEIDPMDLMGED